MATGRDNESKSNMVEQEESAAPVLVRWRGLRTVALFTSFFILGTITLLGPALLDVASRYNIRLQTASIAPVMNEVGYMIGAVLCAVLYNNTSVELLLAICCAIVGASMATCLLSPTFPAFVVIYACSPLACGVLDAAGQTYCLFLWQGHRFSDSLMQCMHAIWSLGAMLTPLVMQPFLNASSSLLSENNATETYSGQVGLSFVILGSTWALPTLIFTACYFILSWTKGDEDDDKPKLSSKKCAGSQDNVSVPRCITRILLIGTCVLMLFMAECITFTFLPSYLVLARNWTTPRAASIDGVMFGSQFAGRIAAVLLSVKLQPGLLLTLCELLVISGTLILFMRWIVAPWISALMVGLGCSCLMPSLILWISRRTPFTSRLSSAMLFSVNAGNIAMLPLLGYLIDKVDPWYMVYIMLLYALVHLLVWLGMLAISVRYFGRKTSPSKKKSDELQLKNANQQTLTPLVQISEEPDNNRPISDISTEQKC